MTAPKPTDLGVWRAGLDRARNGHALLDALISPADAAQLVPKLPSEDLHAFIHQIGLADCTELLSLASGKQVREILDLEVWTRDRLSVERIDPWLNALMHAGPKVLAQRLLDLDDEVLNWVVRRSVTAVVIEDPEDFQPPDTEHVVTPDGRLVVLFPDPSERDLPVKIFLDVLMRDDSALCINLLLGASAALDSTLEEHAYRWRSARMADRGYVDYYEALVVYAPPPTDAVDGKATPSDAQHRDPHRWLAPIVEAEDRLMAAFSALDPEILAEVHDELGYVANMILSADRLDPWDFDAQAVSLQRLQAGLVLGLDVLGGGDPERDAAVLCDHPLSLVFRHGYARMVAAARPARAVRRALRTEADPVGAVDLADLHGWAEALVADRHPRKPDGSPLASADDLRLATQAATRIAALVSAAGDDRPTETGLATWLTTRLALHLMGRDAEPAIPADALEAAHRALFSAPGELSPEARAEGFVWWADRGADPEVLPVLLDEIVHELGQVRPEALEPRFARLFRVGQPTR